VTLFSDGISPKATRDWFLYTQLSANSMAYLRIRSMDIKNIFNAENALKAILALFLLFTPKTVRVKLKHHQPLSIYV